VTACHRFVVLVDDMKVAYFNPNKMDAEFEAIAVERLVKAAKVVRAATKRKLATQIGRGTQTGISRPVYRSGKYAGVNWTARDFGQTMKSVRIVRQRTKVRRALSKKRNVRVYCGHFLDFYANIFEYYKPFMRPAFEQSIPMIKTLIGAK